MSDAEQMETRSRLSPVPKTAPTRWAVRFAIGLAVVAGMLVGGAAWVIHHLDHPWVKSQVTALARKQTGLDLDYAAIDVSLVSGVQVRQVVVRSPESLRAVAPDLLRVDNLDVRWAAAPGQVLPSLLKRVTVRGVALHVTLDEQGRTSFDAIPSPKSTEPEEPSPPLSQLAHAYLGKPLPIEQVTIDDVVCELVRLDQGHVLERDHLRGLRAVLQVAPQKSGSRAALAIGARRAPVILELERVPARGAKGSARIASIIVVTADPSVATLALDLRVQQQDLAPQVPVERLADLDATLHFDAKQKRTLVELTRADLGDGAATARASLVVPDEGAPSVNRAEGVADARHLLQLASPWSPPVRLERGQLTYRIEGVDLDRPTVAARAEVRGDLHEVVYTDEGLELALGHVALALDAAPHDDALSLQSDLTIDRIDVQQPSGRTAAKKLAVHVEGVRTRAGLLTGRGRSSLAHFEQGVVAVDGIDSTIQLRDVFLDHAAPLLSRGDVKVDGKVARIDAGGDPRVHASNLSLHAHMPLVGALRFALNAVLDGEQIAVTSARGKALAQLPLHADVQLADVVPNLVEPARSDGSVGLELAAGALHARVDASKKGDVLDFDLTSEADTLRDLVPFLPADLVSHTPWDKLSLHLHDQGRLERLYARDPQLRHHAELTLDAPAYDEVALRRVVFDVQSTGGSIRHEGKADVRFEDLRVGDKHLGNDHLTLAARVDQSRPSGHLELHSERLPKSRVLADVAFERARQLLRYDVAVDLSGLASLEPLLSAFEPTAGFDLEKFALELRGYGALAGVVTQASERGVVISEDIVRTAAGSANLELSVRELAWSRADAGIDVPAATWLAKLEGEGVKRTLDSKLDIEALTVGLGSERLSVKGLHDQTTVTLVGDPRTGPVRHTQRVAIESVKQRIAPMYAIGGVTAQLVAERDVNGVIKLNELKLDNVAAGTALELSGGFDFGADRQRLSARAKLKQDLRKLSTRRDVFVGDGNLELDVTVASPDFHLIHTLTTVSLDDASVDLPELAIQVSRMNGELPIASDWAVDRDGVELLRGAQVNPYAAQRYADQHPLMSQRSYVTIGSIKTPYVSIAPFAANLRVERNIVSLSQVELGVRKGTITGNGIFEWDGADSKLEANVRASHVMSSHGEPFDGNAALTMDVRARSIEGRADILRIGRRHLFDILDLQDPAHTDPAMNQIRSGLRFGYPDRVRLAFKHGFASAGVEFGGLARLIKVRDVRGIPMGPLMERVLGSLEAPAEEP